MKQSALSTRHSAREHFRLKELSNVGMVSGRAATRYGNSGNHGNSGNVLIRVLRANSRLKGFVFAVAFAFAFALPMTRCPDLELNLPAPLFRKRCP